MKYIAIFTICLFLPLRAQASQPISESMAECSAYYLAAVELSHQTKEPSEKSDMMVEMADAFQEHAYKRALQEGRKNNREYIDSLIIEKGNKWRSKLPNASTVKLTLGIQESLEWAQYCGKMGNHYKVLDELKAKYKK